MEALPPPSPAQELKCAASAIAHGDHDLGFVSPDDGGGWRHQTTRDNSGFH
jgi:hypothetical protein